MKHVLITGSSRGIGLGLAKEFLISGCKVTINGTNGSSVEKGLADLKDNVNEDRMQGFPANITSMKEIEKLHGSAVEAFGPVDIWINNAGVDQKRGMVCDLPAEEYLRVIEINLLGTMYGSKVAFDRMKEGKGGYIFNMEGFGSNDMYQPGVTIYGTSKRAITYFTRSMMKEASGTNVKFGLLSPGMVMTDLLVGDLPTDEKELKTFKKIVNILADEIETVTPFLVRNILATKKNGAHIQWLTRKKATFRFMTAPFNNRDLFEKWEKTCESNKSS